jgi:hypothetical protein
VRAAGAPRRGYAPAVMAIRRRRVPDDWVEKDRWRRWEPPTGGLVALRPGGGRQLRALTAAQHRGAPLPLPAVLMRDDDRVRVALGGQVVGEVDRSRAGEASGLLDAAGRDRIAVPALLRQPNPGGEWPEVALWLDRRLGPGFETVLIAGG